MNNEIHGGFCVFIKAFNSSFDIDFIDMISFNAIAEACSEVFLGGEIPQISPEVCMYPQKRFQPRGEKQ
jgi:hypothetical protein